MFLEKWYILFIIDINNGLINLSMAVFGCMYDNDNDIHRLYIDNLNTIIQVANAFEIIPNTYIRIYFFKSNNGVMNYTENIINMFEKEEYKDAFFLGIFGGLEYI